MQGISALPYCCSHPSLQAEDLCLAILPLVRIEAVIRKLRGGSQAHLVRGDDGRCYAAKFRNNPQGNRALINEWIAHRLLRKLNIPTPNIRLLSLDKESAKSPDLYFSVGSKQVRIEPGIHLGSECPVDPDQTAIFDYLPRRLLSKVCNLADFSKIFVIDQWLCQQDSRQAIFFRARSPASSLNLRVVFIDHGLALGGLDWEFRDSHLRGLYFDRTVYPKNLPAACQETMDSVHSMEDADLHAASDGLPEEWFQNETEKELLRGVMAILSRRRSQIHSLICRQREALIADQLLVKPH